MIETLMALNVVDRERYAEYRAHMKPLLEAHRGSFGLDLWVGRSIALAHDSTVQSCVHDPLSVS